MNQYKKLKVWQKGIDLCPLVYELTKEFPAEEKFALTNQIRRSVVSIPSNIAEGAGRNTQKEFTHFLNIAYGSAAELETQLLISIRLSIVKEEECKNIFNAISEIQKMIFALHNNYLLKESEETYYKGN